MTPDPVLITWLDGTTATYHGETRVSNGVLHVYEYNGARVLIGEYHIPLTSIRVWTKPKA